MKTIILILTIIMLSLPLFSSPRMVARLDNPTPSILQRFISQDADIAAYKPGAWLDLVLTLEQFTALVKEFPSLRITQTEAQLKENLRFAKDIPGYRSYTQMLNELTQLQAQYPGLMQLSSIGTGWGSIYADQGATYYQNFDHELWAVKVSANVQLNEDEPAFYFVGEHHAREPLSTEACMGILIHLLENYGSDPVVTGILDTSEVWIVPLLNPDGHKIVLQETDIWWRKNLRDNNGNQSFNHGNYGTGWDGVDLNRNYSWHWGYTSATDDQNSATYHGPEAFSEPETQALRDFLLSKPFLAGIGYHTYGEYVLYPYGYVDGVAAPDQAELASLAEVIATMLPSQDYGTYAPGPSWGLYPVSGGLDDWMYGETGAFAYTIEMATQFIPPAAQVPQIVQHQVNGALALLLRKNRNTLRGHITDANTGEPISALVLVDGIDDQPVYRKPRSSDPEFGSYHYFLPAGYQTVHYLRPGYATQSLTIYVSPDAQTIQDICLAPTPAQELNILVQNDFFDPLPGAVLSFDDLPLGELVSGPDGYITIADFHPGLYRLTLSKPGYETLKLRREINCTTITLRLTGQPVMSEDFELSLGNWTSTGAWNRTDSESFNGDYSLTDSPNGNYSNNGNSACSLAEPIPLQNVQNANLQFQLKRSLALDGDNLIVEASTNGSSWIVLGFFEGSADWELQSYNLNSFIGHNLYFRFRLNTTSYGSSNGVLIDDLKLFVNADVSANSDPVMPPASLTLTAGPNPFSAVTSISLKTNSAVSGINVGIYNLKGQLIRNLGTRDFGKGNHQLLWDGLDNRGNSVASGIYLLRVGTSGGTLATLRLARIR
ncbi:MAG: M14 family zinc carboxypeptidase [Candidatus Cloacimonetes bacterium]|nr:M14 family zinc carboxypeptidase [Candidatus Cloacimonadota bacterium]